MKELNMLNKLRFVFRRFLGLLGPMPIFEPNEACWSVPTRESREAAALDLYAAHNVTIHPGQTKLISVGVKCDFLPGWCVEIWDRSGLGTKGYHRYAGLIDSDYRGVWKVVLHNSNPFKFTVNRGERVAQAKFSRCWIRGIRIGTVKDNTERGTGGFGSTGK